VSGKEGKEWLSQENHHTFGNAVCRSSLLAGMVSNRFLSHHQRLLGSNLLPLMTVVTPHREPNEEEGASSLLLEYRTFKMFIKTPPDENVFRMTTYTQASLC
jgi:hypothetical protein